MPQKYNRFQFLLYQIFIYEKRHDVQDVARKMGIPASSLYHWIEGELNFPVDLLAQLYNITHDIDFLNFILNDTDQMITARKPAEVKGGMLEETLDVAASTGKLVAEVQKDLA